MTSKHITKTLQNDHIPPRAITSMAKALSFYDASDNLLQNKNNMSDSEIMNEFNKIRLQFLELKGAGEKAWEYASDYGVGHDLARYTAAAATQHKGVEAVYFLLEKRMKSGKTLSQAMDELPAHSFSSAKKEIWQGGDEHKFPNPIQHLNNLARRSLGAKVDTYVSALRSNFEKIDAGMRKVAPMYAKADEELARLNTEKLIKYQSALGPKQKQMLQAVAQQKKVTPKLPTSSQAHTNQSLRDAITQSSDERVGKNVDVAKDTAKSEVDLPRHGASRNTMRGAYKVGLSL